MNAVVESILKKSTICIRNGHMGIHHNRSNGFHNRSNGCHNHSIQGVRSIHHSRQRHQHQPQVRHQQTSCQSDGHIRNRWHRGIRSIHHSIHGCTNHIHRRGGVHSIHHSRLQHQLQLQVQHQQISCQNDVHSSYHSRSCRGIHSILGVSIVSTIVDC